LLVTTDAEAQSSPTAKQVSRIVRRFRLSGDELTYEMDMAWSDGPYERHPDLDAASRLSQRATNLTAYRCSAMRSSTALRHAA